MNINEENRILETLFNGVMEKNDQLRLQNGLKLNSREALLEQNEIKKNRNLIELIGNLIKENRILSD